VYRGRKSGTTNGKPDRAIELNAKGLTVGEVATALGVTELTVFRYVGMEMEGGGIRPASTAAN
jgi:hypothetical protein